MQMYATISRYKLCHDPIFDEQTTEFHKIQVPKQNISNNILEVNEDVPVIFVLRALHVSQQSLATVSL